jgi:DNA-binding LacI/PurR family transcriptional regulator
MPTKSKSATSKMQAYRDRLRAHGLKPVQVWVPDVDAPGFKEDLRRQVAALNESDEARATAFIEAVLDDPANDLSR